MQIADIFNCFVKFFDGKLEPLDDQFNRGQFKCVKNDIDRFQSFSPSNGQTVHMSQKGETVQVCKFDLRSADQGFDSMDIFKHMQVFSGVGIN